MNIVPRQPRKPLNPKEAAEALFAKRNAAPRILEDAPKPVIVETRRSRGLAARAAAKAPNANAPAKSPNKVCDAVSGAVQIVQSQLTAELHVITPETARFMRDTMHFERQRKISPANVDRLANEMKNGTFIPGTQVYLCELPSGQRMIVNANHTLEAIAASGVPQVMVVTCKRVKDIDEAGRLYAVFDIHKARSWLDSLKATGISDGDSATKNAKVLAALGCIENKLDQMGTFKSASRLGRIERMAEYEDVANIFWQTVAGAPKDGMRFATRAPVMAVALITLRYQPSLAVEFWRNFAHDNGLAEGMPEKALLSYLRNNKAVGGAMARKLQVRAVASAWNAKFRDADVQYVKPGAMTSFFLLGTNLAKGLEGASE